jgi:hypothetical protein
MKPLSVERISIWAQLLPFPIVRMKASRAGLKAAVITIDLLGTCAAGASKSSPRAQAAGRLSDQALPPKLT